MEASRFHEHDTQRVQTEKIKMKSACNPGTRHVAWVSSLMLSLCLGCNGGEMRIHGYDVPEGDAGVTPPLVEEEDMDVSLVSDSGTIDEIEEPPPLKVLQACTADSFWPVDTPLRVLTPTELYHTLEATFFPDSGDPRLRKVGTRGRAFDDWLTNPKAGKGFNTGITIDYPSPNWSEDSFTYDARGVTDAQLGGFNGFVDWFFDDAGRNQDGSYGPFNVRAMYGRDEQKGWSPCQVDHESGTTSEALACGEAIVEEVMPKLWRRPLDAQELALFKTYMDERIEDAMANDPGREPGDRFLAGLRAFFRTATQTPQFLYHIEEGNGEFAPDRQAVTLTQRELANRLSYYLWKSPPDQELVELADRGELEGDVYDAQIRRLLTDERARVTIEEFFSGWLKLEKAKTFDVHFRDKFMNDRILDVPHSTKDENVAMRVSWPVECGKSEFIEVPRTTVANWVEKSIRASLDETIRWAFWQEDSFASMMSGEKFVSNPLLSRYMGWPEPPLVEVDPPDDMASLCDAEQVVSRHLNALINSHGVIEIKDGTRQGILTHPGILAMSSHGGKHSPIFRGVHLLNSVLCQELGFPTALEFESANAEQKEEICTTREYVTISHTEQDGSCVACHGLIDGIGFAFEHYDKVGVYVTEQGHYQNRECEVDASTTIPERTGVNEPLDFAGEIKDATQLTSMLGTSTTAKACMIAHWMRHVHRRDEIGIGQTLTRRDSSEQESQLATIKTHERTCQQHQIDELIEQMDASGGSLQEMLIALLKSPSFTQKSLDAHLENVLDNQQGESP